MPAAPTPPDPKETGAAQTGVNIGTAVANNQMRMVDQYTPDGSLTYDQTGTYNYNDPYTGQSYDIPRFSATTTLSPEQQAIADASNEAKINLSSVAADRASFLRDYLPTAFNLDNIPGRGEIPGTPGSRSDELTRTYGTDFSQDRQRVEDALMERLNPQLQRDEEALRTRLVNQGITQGSEAWRTGMDDFTRQSNDARLSAILGAGQEQSRLAGLEAQRAGFENQATGQAAGMDLNAFDAQMRAAGLTDAQRAAALQEQFAMRNQPINEITALLSGSQVSMPNVAVQQPQGAATTDVAGLINQNYNQRYNNYQQQVAQQQGLLGGLFDLGAAGIGAWPFGG